MLYLYRTDKTNKEDSVFMHTDFDLNRY